MFQVEHSNFIKRPRQAVFDIITDPDRITEWGASESAEWISDGEPGVGSKRRTTGKFLGRKLDIISEVIAWEPPSQFTFKSAGNVEVTLHHTIESKDGGSQLTVRGEIDMRGLFKIAEPLLKRQVDKQMEADIGAIKLILESEGE